MEKDKALKTAISGLKRLALLLSIGLVIAGPAHAQRAAGTPPVLSCPSGTLLFDWDSATSTWAAGSLSNNYNVTGLGSFNIGITKSGGTWVTDATYGGTAPFRQKIDTYGFSPAQFMLQQWIDFSTSSQTTTTTITLPTAVPGTQFRLYDIDYSAGGFADKITVTGTFNGASVTPTLTNGVTNYVTGNVAIGDGTSAANSPNGILTVTFAAPVDTIVIAYGNNVATSPANPTAQAYDLYDITFCKPQAAMTVSKISSILADPVNGTTNPKAIPGATVRYCLLASNAGSATATNMAFGDPLPIKTTYVAGTMRSGTSCASAATVEDDDNSDATESDAVQASFSGSTLSASVAKVGPSTAYALIFDAIIQ